MFIMEVDVCDRVCLAKTHCVRQDVVYSMCKRIVLAVNCNNVNTVIRIASPTHILKTKKGMHFIVFP